MSSTQVLDTLLLAYGKHETNGTLNTAMRKALRLHAAAEKLQFQQDRLGNIYITRHGRDAELANISIIFPLDSNTSPTTFTSAFRVFSQLASENLVCGVTLMGCTSIHSENIGLQLWDTCTSASEDTRSSTAVPQLQQFSNLPNPADFSFSALFEVSEIDAALSMQGSPVLIKRAETHTQNSDDIIKSYRNYQRAPCLLINGHSAESITKYTICGYSEYIAALFDNFE